MQIGVHLFAPFEQADEMVKVELFSLLEHDNAKYLLTEKVDKRQKDGSKRNANGPSTSVPVIGDFDENELKNADSLIKEDAEILCVAMGHENESPDEFFEAHKTCLNDLMYFPTRGTYGLSSIAGNIAALQNEFDNVKKKMDDNVQKAASIENKVKVSRCCFCLFSLNIQFFNYYWFFFSRVLLDSETTVTQVLTNQELHGTVYQHG
ncbi:unnamed protein product [Malus baccata var. baccata]